MRRLGRYTLLTIAVIADSHSTDSVTRSPLYSIYGETISGVTILRAFGASSKFLRDMLRCVDTVRTPVNFALTVSHFSSEREPVLLDVGR